MCAGVMIISVGASFGIWAAKVYAPCAVPYARCAADHPGNEFGGMFLFALTAVFGFIGIVWILSGLYLALRKRH